MKNKIGILGLFISIIMLAGCGTTAPQRAGNIPSIKGDAMQADPHEVTAGEAAISSGAADKDGYRIRPVELVIKEGRAYVPVGAEFTTQEGKVDLGEVIRAMADHKGFSVSWADDVDQQKPVDCYIKAADDFYNSLDNILRQLDYYYEIEEDTIVIKYKETKKYHVAMPSITEKLDTGLGGDMLPGGEGETGLKATAALQINSEEFSFWDDLQTVLTETVKCEGCPPPVIDKALGTIIVTASKSVHAAIERHLAAIEEEAYKQVIVEAKIIEVSLSDEYAKGINWGNVVGGIAENGDLQGKTLGGTAVLGENNVLWDTVDKWNSFLEQITIANTTWDVVVSAFEKYGDTRILSNPKVHILNGHSAVMSAGQVIKYLEACDVSEGELGGLEFEAKIASITEGLSIAIKANVKGDDDVVLYTFPAITRLIQFKDIFASQCGLIQAPEMAVRELATYAKVRDGAFLVIGGLIQKSEDEDSLVVPVLGDLPYVGKFFRYDTGKNRNSELVIILRPTIVHVN